MPRPVRPAALAVAFTVLALTGCGAEVTAREGTDDAARAGGGRYPVTVENCGEKKTFERAPRRVVTNDVGITEIMFALGLEDHMAGYVMPDDKGDLTSVPWKDGYTKTEWLSKEQINKELVLDARADLVFAGWNYGFNEGDGFTPAELGRVGIDSYVLSESCRNGQGKARGVMSPLDALYTDLRNLGTVFDVEDRAEGLITSFRKEVAEAQAKAAKGADRPRVFLYDDGQDKPFTSGAFAGPHDIITKAAWRPHHEGPRGQLDHRGLGDGRRPRSRSHRDQQLRGHHRRAEAEVPHVVQAPRERLGRQERPDRRPRLRGPRRKSA